MIVGRPGLKTLVRDHGLDEPAPAGLGRGVTEYAELNWTISMIVSASILRISRYQDLAVETLNWTRHWLSCLGELCGVRVKAAVDVAVVQVKPARRYVVLPG